MNPIKINNQKIKDLLDGKHFPEKDGLISFELDSYFDLVYYKKDSQISNIHLYYTVSIEREIRQSVDLHESQKELIIKLINQ